MLNLLCALRAAYRYRGYLPQRLTVARVTRWLRQFERRDRKFVRRLLNCIIYFSEEKVREILLKQNEALMERLLSAGLRPHQLIYVQVHDAGSSSAVMLNMLRDTARLEQRGCTLLDSKDTLGLTEATNDFGEGALIYVDDFVGSGTQLCEARDFAAQYVVGTFAEFVLTPSICEEGREVLDNKGIEVFSGHVHTRSERPLDQKSDIFEQKVRQRLSLICESIDSRSPLGFKKMAVMVILYRNAPDNVPVIFRGSGHQTPYVGVFPRTTDLPFN